MKLELAVMCVALIGNVTVQCTSHTKLWTPKARYSASSVQDSGNSLPEIPYDFVLRTVAGLAKQTGVANLRDTKLRHGQTEIRIWKGFGLLTPRCLLLTTRNGTATASFLRAKVRQNRAVFRNGSIVYVNTPLDAPRSGWDSFLAYLREHGIGSSIDMALDKRYVPEPDGELLVLEMKNGSRHSMAYYDESTASVDGKKAFDICKRIRSEFDVNLGCQ